jgi:hypothetical protein
MNDRKQGKDPLGPKRTFPDRPGWLNPPLLAVLVILFLFSSMMAWTLPPSEQRQQEASPTVEATAIPEEVVIDSEPTRTPIPQEWVENVEQTNGVVFGGVILVLIIVGGTLHAIQQKPKK